MRLLSHSGTFVRMVKSLAVFLLLTCTYAMAADPVVLVGTVTNTTNSKQPISAQAVLSVDKDGHCILEISPPLFGSGTCTIKAHEQQTGRLEIASEGALINITAAGTVKSDVFAGTYTVVSVSTPDLPQQGTFEFRAAPNTQAPLQLSDVLSWSTFKSGDEEFLTIRDGDVVSVHHKDGRYAGTRLFGEGWKASFFIQDSDKVSTYRDINSKNVILTWIREGDTGYFIQPVNGGQCTWTGSCNQQAGPALRSTSKQFLSTR